MRMRVLLAAGALAIVPALAGAQQRPATPPAQQPRPATPPTARPATPPTQQPRPTAQPAQRPAATPAARPAVAAAHREGSFELTGAVGGLYTSAGVADITGYNKSGATFLPGVAVRATYNFSQKLGLSGNMPIGFGSGITFLQPALDLVYTMDLNKKFSPLAFVGVGGTHTLTAVHTSGIAPHVGVGFRSFLGDRMALRAEAGGYVESFSSDNYRVGFGTSGTSVVGTVSVGLSYFMGGGPPKDTDVDGVPDKKDACAATPRGATVDLRGCPSDTDRDGVLNGLDACPNTPANTPVDARGCTRDTDNDGVADNLDRCANTPANARPVNATGCPVDSDNDAVPDYLDRCANTAAGVPVDANGCPRDTDNDGVTDNNDRCPNTLANARPVDATGCPVDSDHDGVADYLDRCSNTAPNTQVDANGCPIARDADADGVIDANDRCANTPANARVDATGCPLAELPAAGAALVIRNINFRASTATLLPTSNAELDKIAIAILATPNSRWEVGGYTDSRGVPAANQRLSQARAQAVMQYLVSKTVPAASLTAVGYGSQRPAAPNTTAAGRAQNRRVEIKRIQ